MQIVSFIHPSKRRYHGKIAFGEALRANADISRLFGITEYPALLIVCGGNRDVTLKYTGGWARGVGQGGVRWAGGLWL